MAQKVHMELVDDLDGSGAEETVVFGVDGVDYEIDLNADNAERLREALADYVDCARRVKAGKSRGGKPTSRGAVTRPDREQTRAARAWLRKKGHDISDRGRIPADKMEIYLKSA